MRSLPLLPWLGRALARGGPSTPTGGAVDARGAVLSPAPAERAWLVEDGGAFLGSVVRFGSSDGSDGFYYMVRNPWDQDVGLVDHLGRAWKRIPHEEDAWLGTGTVLEGVRLVLGAGDGARMEEHPVDRLEALTRAARARVPGGIDG